ncbi:MAG TPA: glycosyltransferase family 39 protein [Acidimicrobiales bacterium]|nr:glycosyltransferase family 39 protein [Acidimicrobiales bacterium]
MFAIRRRHESRRGDLGVALILLGGVALEMAVSARYGYHRDELYFLVAGQHPALGYVDQPLLAPMVARLSSVLFVNSLVGLRVIPAMLLGWLVVSSSSMARLLGGGVPAQRLAALATAACGEYLATAHLLTTTVFDFAAWAGVLWSCAHFLESEESRWLLVAGTFAGVGLDAKWNIGFLVGALIVGFAVTTSARRLVPARTALAAVAIVAALGWPDFLWQALHGWPNIPVFRTLQLDAGHNRAVYWPAQILYTGLAATPLWATGLVALWRRESPDRRWRSLATASIVVLVLQFILGGKPYYVGGIFVLLFAAGAVALERRWTLRRGRGLRSLGPTTTMAALAVSGLITIPLAIPVLPAKSLHTLALQKINYDLAETIAWPREVGQIAAVFRSLPEAQRKSAIILAGNYGEAGALDRYGAQFKIPPGRIYSGANSFWLWGPPPRSATTVVAVNMNPATLRRFFSSVRLALVYTNGLGVSNDEQGVEVMVATGLRLPWSSSWLGFRNYS